MMIWLSYCRGGLLDIFRRLLIRWEKKIENYTTMLHICVQRRGVFEEISRLQHRFEDIISTTLHNHMGASCLEVILIRGDIARIRELAERLKAIRGIEVVRVTVA